MAVKTTPGSTREIYQIRIKPYLGWFYRKHPVYYDSSTLFVSLKLAQAAVSLYIKELIEIKRLDPKKPYEIEILKLTLLNTPIEGRYSYEDHFGRVGE